MENKMDSILFDLDGTLWDSTVPAAVIWRQVASEYPQITDEISAKRLKKFYGLPLEEIARGLFASVPYELAVTVMEECVTRQCPYLAEHGGVLLGEVEAVLTELKKKYRLFIVSNCRSGYIEAFLTAHRLWDYFEDFTCPGETGKLKAENNRIIMERNGLKAPVYVGDTKGDGIAARKAGIPFVYARYGFGEATEYEYVIDSLNGLVELFG